MDFDELDELDNVEELKASAEDAKETGDCEEAPLRQPPPWKKVSVPEIPYMKMTEVASRNLPGDYYGIKFPHSTEQILDFGPQWLTEAFHTSGVLPKDNAVTKIVSAREFVGGGAGLKCVMTVEYKMDKPYLHKELFVKLPHKPGGNDRYFVSCMWNHDRPETIFNIWLEKKIPYRVPKCYFADICAETTNCILITENIPWGQKGKTDFKPGDIEPAYDKYMDWELPDGGPMYYHACCKALGKIAAYHKAGKLHPQTNEMFPMPDEILEIPTGLPGLPADQVKTQSFKMDQFIKFVSETARAVFPAEITDKDWLQQWKNQALHFMDYSAEVHCFMMGAGTGEPNDYVGLTHNNLQIDNAFFWRNDDNKLEVGMLDWGVLGCAPLITAVQGCISGATEEVLLAHRDEFLETMLGSYELYGGGKLDAERFQQMSDLGMMQWACSVIANVSQVLKHTKAKEWAEIKEWSDERLLSRFQTRAHTTQFKISLLLWRKWDLYNKFLQWLEQEDLPMKKKP